MKNTKPAIGHLYTTTEGQHRLVIGLNGSKVYFDTRGYNSTADYNSIYKPMDENQFLKESWFVCKVPTAEKKRVLLKNASYIKKNGL